MSIFSLLCNGTSHSPPLWGLVSGIYDASDLNFTQVRGEVYNVIADHLSHGRVDEAQCHARRMFGVPLSMHGR